MLKLRSISKTDFDNYIKKQKDNLHFMQTSAWGEFEKVINQVTPHYLGLVENNKLIAATLLIEKHLPINQCYLYAPRGFIIDYKNNKLLTLFINKLKNFANYKKAIAIKINPAIYYKKRKNNNTILNKDSGIINANLKQLNFKRKKESKSLEYTYKIDLSKSIEEIEKEYSEKIKTTLLATKMYDIELVEGTYKDLQELLKSTEKDNNNYDTLYEIFTNDNYTKIKLLIGKLHITKTLKKIEKELKKINNQISIIPIDNLDTNSKKKLTTLRKEKEILNKDLEQFKKYKLKYGNFITLNHMLLMEQDKKTWLLTEINNNTFEETNLNTNIYHECIKYYKNKEFKCLYNSNLKTKNSIQTEFSKEFGSEYIEYMGEYELITNKFMYIVQNKIIPLFKKGEKQ